LPPSLRYHEPKMRAGPGCCQRSARARVMRQNRVAPMLPADRS
jgi:hypothetical protein